MASDEVRRLARIRMQVTGETFDKALAALEGRVHAPSDDAPKEQLPRQTGTGPGKVVLLRADGSDRDSGG